MKNQFSRRTLLESAGAGLLGPALPAAAQNARPAGAAARPAPVPLNRFPAAVQDYFMARVREAERRNLGTLAGLKTKEDALAHVRMLRDRIRLCFGRLPEKTPLKPRINGVVERDTYRIEKVIFESRPGFLVTANLYVPKRKPPLPAVVGTCGHTDTGKAGDTYQAFAQGLARLGYICLLFDPIGQGERLQYGGVNPKVRPGVNEHLMGGNQQFLVGEFLGTWRAWDGIRALDYLLTRPEVDKRHLGVTGNSGGGTMTTWLCGLESRWTMAAPSCFVTTFRRNLENELPADTEQCPPHALAMGLDHADFIAAMAPKPVILMGKEHDFFDVRGLEAAYARLKRLYKLLGAEKNIELFVGAGYHGYTQDNREAMYRWFNGITKISDAKREPPLTMEKEETLRCTPGGQVAEMGSRPVYGFTKERSQALAQKRTALQGEALAHAVARTLHLPPRKGVADYRILRPIGGRGFPKKQFATYAVETEPGIQTMVYLLSDEPLYSRPPRGEARAILYVSHQSADVELREEPFVRELLQEEPKTAFFACDVRGIGESRPDTCGSNMFLNPYGSDYFYAIHGIMLDRPYVGQRTHDVLAVLDWLHAQGHTEVHVAGLKWGTVPAVFAALLSPTVSKVTLKGAPESYASIAEAVTYDWPLALLPFNVLAEWDLPDCYGALKAKGLRRS